MEILKKIGYTALALVIGGTGVYGTRTIQELQKQNKDQQVQLTNQEDQIGILSYQVAQLEDLLGTKASKEEVSTQFEAAHQNLEEQLTELASALSNQKLTQNKKLEILRNYDKALTFLVLKDKTRMENMLESNKNLADLVNTIDFNLRGVFEVLDELTAATYEPSNFEKNQSIIAPSVRVNCDLETGSGTIIYSEEENGIFYNYVLTALHVVQGANENKPIGIDLFDATGAMRVQYSYRVNLAATNEQNDLALIEIITNEQLPSATFVSNEQADQIQRFDEIYAVGCPLGYPPSQTEGEITTKNKVLAGETYWMINANTIFGNSGGGIFLENTGELIGVLTRVSAYNNFINIAVPHMGIIIPPNSIYDWFENDNLQFLYNSDYTRENCFRSRNQIDAGHEANPNRVDDASVVRPILK